MYIRWSFRIHHVDFPKPTEMALLLSSAQWMTHTILMTTCPVYGVKLLMTPQKPTVEHVLYIIETFRVRIIHIIFLHLYLCHFIILCCTYFSAYMDTFWTNFCSDHCTKGSFTTTCFSTNSYSYRSSSNTEHSQYFKGNWYGLFTYVEA